MATSGLTNEVKAGADIGISYVSLQRARGPALGPNGLDRLIGGYEIDVGANNLGTLASGQARDSLPVAWRIALALEAHTTRANDQDASASQATAARCLAKRLVRQCDGWLIMLCHGSAKRSFPGSSCTPAVFKNIASIS